MTFGDRLSHAWRTAGRFCAGIDPHPALLDAWGLTDSVNGLEKFAMTAVEAFAGRSPVVKPQSAFFERFGSRGIAVLEKVVEGCRELGCLVLLDVKRGDIGTTAQAYADAYLDQNSPLSRRRDHRLALPRHRLARPDLRHRAGQRRRRLRARADVQPGGRRRCSTRSPPTAAPSPGWCSTPSPPATPASRASARSAPWWARPSSCRPTWASATSTSTARCWCPGIGAQGGTLDDVRRVFGDAARNVLPTSSREMLAAGPTRPPCTTPRCRPSTSSAPSPGATFPEARVMRGRRHAAAERPRAGRARTGVEQSHGRPTPSSRPATCRSRSHPSTRSGTSTTVPPSTPPSPSSAPRSRRSPPRTRAATFANTIEALERSGRPTGG